MKSALGTALMTCALALAGCSSGAPPAAEEVLDGTGSNVESLRRPARGPAQRPPRQDPCDTARCGAGTHCEAVDRAATCAPDEPTNPCAVVLCPVDTRCEVIDGEATCTGLQPAPGSSPFCGGIAAIECPGAGSCVDDAGDDCDPDRGGADCGGVCECNALALCVEGFAFDASPEVCACVPVEPEVDACALVRCAAGTHCEVEADGSATCVADDPCTLIDCPPDRPRCEVDAGEAVCRAEPPPAAGPFCGGIAAFECPGAGSCVDDPADDCDPERGGADCGGVCECNVLALCIEGNVFDASPDVCACVADPCTTTLLLCAPGTSCQAIDGEPVCTPIEPNPCAAVLCPAETACDVVDGEAVCSPIGPNPCSAVLCARGSRCVARGDEAHCVEGGSRCRHER